MRLVRDTRLTLGLAIEALIELLDAIGPDPEAEPSLGSTEGHHWQSMNQEITWGRASGTNDNREGEHDGVEPEPDEPSLAVPEQINQACSSAHPGNAQELEAEHDGREPREG